MIGYECVSRPAFCETECVHIVTQSGFQTECAAAIKNERKNKAMKHKSTIDMLILTKSMAEFQHATGQNVR